jgi:isoleucyl-tRNA synthetase
MGLPRPAHRTPGGEEHQAEEKLELSKLDTRKECRAYARQFIDIQREEFKRLGGIGDWEHPYVTMDFDYQATIIEEASKFFLRGEVYRKKKPVYWCLDCETALAEAEIEYDTKRSSSIYVKFPYMGEKEPVFAGYPDKPVYMLIWTTTPGRFPRTWPSPFIPISRTSPWKRAKRSTSSSKTSSRTSCSARE